MLFGLRGRVSTPGSNPKFPRPEFLKTWRESHFSKQQNEIMISAPLLAQLGTVLITSPQVRFANHGEGKLPGQFLHSERIQKVPAPWSLPLLSLAPSCLIPQRMPPRPDFLTPCMQQAGDVLHRLSEGIGCFRSFLKRAGCWVSQACGVEDGDKG